MTHVKHEAASRGYADHGWLKSYHTFSFADYFNRNRMNFGALRVINDDWIDAAQGFGTHPHKDMEIISVPLSGRLEHKDSMGSHYVIRAGEVQVMSAGTGVQHSEFNPSPDEPATLLQIWVMPKTTGVKPRYDQKDFSAARTPGQWQLLVSPDGRQESLMIHQDAFFSWVDLKAGQEIPYRSYDSKNGVYLFAVSGRWTVNDLSMDLRDGLGFIDTPMLNLVAKESGAMLVMEVPPIH